MLDSGPNNGGGRCLGDVGGENVVALVVTGFAIVESLVENDVWFGGGVGGVWTVDASNLDDRSRWCCCNKARVRRASL